MPKITPHDHTSFSRGGILTTTTAVAAPSSVAHSETTGQTATDHHAAPVAGPDADVTVDAAGAAGTASAFARSAHGHQLVTYSSPAATLGTAAAGTSGTAPSRGDHVHAHGTGTVATAHAHADLSDVSADQHHAQSHVLATTAGLGADHSTSGLTAGYLLRASAAGAAAFVQVWVPARIEGFMAENIPSNSAADQPFGRFASANTAVWIARPLGGVAGRAIGLDWRKSGAISGGSIVLSLTIGGVVYNVVTLDSGSLDSGVATISPVSFGATSKIGVLYDTNATYAPTTVDYAADVLIEVPTI